jgi:hypothetical protein
MNNTLQSIYKEKREHYSFLFHKTNKQIKTISFLRLLDFLLAIILIYIFTRANYIEGIVFTIFISIGIFVYLIKYHSKLLSVTSLYEAKIKLNKNELITLFHLILIYLVKVLYFNLSIDMQVQ